MQQFLDVFHQYSDKIIHVLTWVGSLGVLDVLFRKIPTDKPKSILIFVQDICRTIDKLIDSVPGMKQNLKSPEEK